MIQHIVLIGYNKFCFKEDIYACIKAYNETSAYYTFVYTIINTCKNCIKN